MQQHDAAQGVDRAPLREQPGLEVYELADELSGVARRLQATDDTDEMLAAVVAAAIDVIPGVDEASLSVVTGRRKVEAQHPSSDLPAQVDAIQNAINQGPCLEAIYEQTTITVPDLRREQRWPLFARLARDLGVGSMLSFQLYVEGDNLGALNLYSRQPNAFDAQSEQIGQLFASHAAVAFADARKLDQTQTAIRSRDVIGQAKGILMERYKIGENRAFQVLVRYSQSAHRKLHDVAVELTGTGQLPTLERDPRAGGL